MVRRSASSLAACAPYKTPPLAITSLVRVSALLFTSRGDDVVDRSVSDRPVGIKIF